MAQTSGRLNNQYSKFDTCIHVQFGEFDIHLLRLQEAEQELHSAWCDRRSKTPPMAAKDLSPDFLDQQEKAEIGAAGGTDSRGRAST
ncbi:hypothetical protein FALBO_12848 [Fusarium albosuccineum]|uniref:Uncharacterized protein n=1 Tax=Fusarium albosuccineum TaxID=1237068 RepID=A0A8H4L3A1_9HYPO|nr:hypothetical protein FALBO_12848 [Fusarium albosuccineum]